MRNMNCLLKEISEALRLDNENNEKEAYKKYVDCIFAIVSNLMEAVKSQGGEVVVNHTIMKQVKLIQQCTDRVAELIKIIIPQLNQCSITDVTARGTAETTVCQTEKGQHGRFSAPVPELLPENNPHAVVVKSRSLTPMEMASKQNQSLMIAFKARMLRLNRSDFNAYNYSLAIQRKMMENIAIARAQEEELARKMQARNQRLEHEAAKRFASPSGMSEDEKKLKKIYKKILEYENEAVPLSEDLWPVYEDVKDIVGQRRKNNESFENSNPEQDEHAEGFMVESHLNARSLKKENIADDHTNVTSSNGNITNDNISLHSPTLFNIGSDNENSQKNSSSENEVKELGVFGCSQEHTENDVTKSSTDGQQQDLKRRDRIVSWERRQAKLLMKEVNKRCALKTCVNMEDDDDLDYLFEDDNEEATDIMYSSMSFIRTSPEIDSPLEEEKKIDKNQIPSRSVSHEIQSPSSLVHQDSGDLYQSLPYSGYKERVSEFEEAKKIAKLSHEACESHLKTICEDIHCYLEKLLVLMTIAYEPLDTPVGKDQCAVSLEEPFFKQLWKSLLLLFRVVNFRQEQVLACVMTKYQSATLSDLNVNKKLWLTSNLGQSMSSGKSYEKSAKPYEKVVTELKRVGDHYTMLSKLECIVKVCRLICECVDDHYGKSQQEGGKKAPSIGADDLVPILCYCVIQSATPQLASECEAMAEFIQEGYLMGEEGYCLTTLRTALSFVTSLFSEI
ncbi:hypothetical protein EGW08_008419 [Elysia chlorotica]|uniref:VPS9 domain-containing protein n=1 Tax=Elysia chlorotica TaxID=188477 RepID=A0A433TQG8_ELYCH|nr:hypothetical protein EGW08_008419 [Elysia chlorotica]